MKKFSSPQNKIKLILLTIFLLTLACGLPFFPGDSPLPSPTSSTAVSPDAGETDSTEPTQEQQTTLPTLGGGEMPVPDLPPTMLSKLLEQRVEDGVWEQGEGLVYLLRYLAGELAPEEIPQFEAPEATSATALIARAHEYLNAEDPDPEAAAEIERLLEILIPDQSDLDRLSGSGSDSETGGLYRAGHSTQGGTSSGCANLKGEGFSAKLDPGTLCYDVINFTTGSTTLQIYFPKQYRDNDDLLTAMERTRLALVDSVESYRQYGKMGDINLAFSMSQPADKENTWMMVSPFDADEICPITVLPSVKGMDFSDYEQTVAHEVFHCFQGFNFENSFSGDHDWWVEGSAVYFSNTVYPDNNLEHRWVDNYYIESISKSLLDMEYPNALPMQFFGNKMGNSGLIELLDNLGAMGDKSTQQTRLATWPGMDETYQEFVVATMSEGVLDTGGGRIVQRPTPVRRIEAMDQEEWKVFKVEPFVAGFYGLRYLPEHRILEEPDENANVRHSVALNEIRSQPGAWSSLPPEVRSRCDEDEEYALVITAVDGPGEFIAKINRIEEAECDPCVLGTWRLDYEEHPNINRAIEANSGGVPLQTELAGDQFLRFDENGEVTSRLADLTISFTMEGSPSVQSTANAHGSGDYTADGEELTFFNHSSQTDHMEYLVEGVGKFDATPDFISSSLMNFKTPNLMDFGSETAQAAVSYVCSEDTLTLTHPLFGDQVLDRTDEILPTPVPTPGGGGQNPDEGQ